MKLTAQQKFLILALIAALFYVLMAYLSKGYYHADEQFQIIEFAGYKLGTHTGSELTWEFDERMRSILQPFIFILITKIAHFFGTVDAYNIIFIARALTGILSVLCIHFFIGKIRPLILNPKFHFPFALASYFIWFVPYLAVRYSSENLAALCLLVAIGLSINTSWNVRKSMLVGAILGLGFLFRFQLGFAIVGYFLWLVFIKKIEFKNLFAFCSGILLLIGFGSMLDSWFYGEWVFTPWNYFYQNIVSTTSPSFGNEPWDFFINKFTRHTGPFLNYLLSFVLLIGFIFERRNIIVWCVIPFILAHSLVLHKEFRFLFPLLYLLVPLFFLALNQIDGALKNFSYKKWIYGALVSGFLVVNTIGLAAMTQKSADMGHIAITSYIHDHYGDQKINLIAVPFGNPYNPWGRPIKFYQEKNMITTRIEDLCELNADLIQEDAINLLVIRQIDGRKGVCHENLNLQFCHFIKQSIPPWIEKVNTIYKGFDPSNIIELYELR